MSVGFARPDVSNLVFHLYGRSVHPELFQVHAQSEIEQADYSVAIQICDAGHVIAFRHGAQIVSELTATRKQPLPQQKKILEKRIRGCRDESLRLEPGIAYHSSYQLEQLDSEVFLALNDELLLDCRRAEVVHRFPAGNRLAPEPLSLIKADVWPRSLLIHAFHTFPENCAIVKTQSLFEI